jgi:hypothetical protein
MVAAEIGGPCAGRGDNLCIVRDDEACARGLDHRHEFGQRQPRGDHRRCRAELPQRESQLEQRVAVGQGQHDEIVLPYARGGQCMRAPPHAIASSPQLNTSSSWRTAHRSEPSRATLRSGMSPSSTVSVILYPPSR